MLDIIENRIKEGKFVLIAEIGVNYYDIAKKENIIPIEAAKIMIKGAADSGVHAVKFQSYKAETLAAKDSPYYWDLSEEPTKTQYELFEKYDDFGEKEYIELANYSEICGVEFMSTAFDISSADYLEPLMNVYKISSSDLNNLPFIEYQARKNKPIILSVGASDRDEIEKSVNLIRKYNDRELALLHCVLEYPTPYDHANLEKIRTLRELFPDLSIGYSDHTKPDREYNVLKTAYLLGARIIEKHFTLDKTLKGNDHYHSMEPDDVRRIISEIEFIDKLRGEGDLVCLESEKAARTNARRSLVTKSRIKKGNVVTKDVLTWKRPGTGIPVEQIKKIIGKKALCDIPEDTILKYDFLDL